MKRLLLLLGLVLCASAQLAPQNSRVDELPTFGGAQLYLAWSNANPNLDTVFDIEQATNLPPVWVHYGSWPGQGWTNFFVAINNDAPARFFRVGVHLRRYGEK